MKPVAKKRVGHPAVFHPKLLAVIAAMLKEIGAVTVLDPFAGVGKVHTLAQEIPYLITVGVELEPEWANQHPATRVGDATALPPAWTGRFDAIVTSPGFGNRMADQFTDHQVGKGYKRNTYRHYLGRRLSPNNGAGLPFGRKYCVLHRNVWQEARRVLGLGLTPKWLVLDIKDHIRNGRRVRVTLWHKLALASLGFRLVREERVYLAGNQQGANRSARIPYHSVLLFELVA